MAFFMAHLVDAVSPGTRDSATVARATERAVSAALSSLGEQANSVAVDESGRTALVVMGALVGLLSGAVVIFASLWWEQRRENRLWRPSYDKLRAEHSALVAGAPLTLVNVCRECRRLMRGDA